MKYPTKTKPPITAKVYAWPPHARLLVDADPDGTFHVFQEAKNGAVDLFLPDVRSFAPQKTFGALQAKLDHWARVRGLAIVAEEAACRVCGCRQNRACCDEESGETCHWVEADLCSACQEKRGQHHG